MKTIMMIIALATSFMPGSKTESKSTNSQTSVSYYWFNTSGTYLRQNTTLAEFTLTGYDNNMGNPKTLQELGYDPINCTGTNPPVPNDPDSPDQMFYSHP